MKLWWHHFPQEYIRQGLHYKNRFAAPHRPVLIAQLIRIDPVKNPDQGIAFF